MIRDFTYIDDIVEGTMHVIDRQPKAEDCPHGVPAKVYNIGCSNPVKLMDFISELEQAYGRPAEKIFLPMQPGDVYQTNADTRHLEEECGYKPHWSLHDGMQEFMRWFKEYHESGVKN
jgi:UDP-glucuronate 4-epimerase